MKKQQQSSQSGKQESLKAKVERRGAIRLLLLLPAFYFLLCAIAHADNTNVVNDKNHPIPVSLQSTAGVARTLPDITATSSGTVTAGAKRVTCVFSSDFTGTVNGVTWSGATDAQAPPYVAPASDTLPAIAYTVTAGNIRIMVVR